MTAYRFFSIILFKLKLLLIFKNWLPGGKGRLHFVEKKAKVDCAYYIGHLLPKFRRTVQSPAAHWIHLPAGWRTSTHSAHAAHRIRTKCHQTKCSRQNATRTLCHPDIMHRTKCHGDKMPPDKMPQRLFVGHFPRQERAVMRRKSLYQAASTINARPSQLLNYSPSRSSAHDTTPCGQTTYNNRDSHHDPVPVCWLLK